MMNMMEDMMIREKSGSADIDFLKGMIPHHEAAIKMSESYLNYGGEVSDLETLAQDIITAQKKELTEMNDLVKKYEKEGKKNQEKKCFDGFYFSFTHNKPSFFYEHSGCY